MADYGCYANLTEFKAALAESGTSEDSRLLTALEDASRRIDDHCQRHFYSKTATRYYTGRESRRLLLDDDLLTVATLKTDEDDDYDYDYLWTTDDYHLMPFNEVVKWELRTKPNGDYSFPRNERGVEIAGIWGYGDGWSATPWLPTSCTITAADGTGLTLVPSDQSLLRVGQTIIVGTEQMYVTTLTDGGVGADSMTVVRAVNGTTGAAHLAGSAVSTALYPTPIRRACLRLAARTYRLEAAPFGVAGNADMGTVPVQTQYDPEVLHWLAPYRHPRVG
jgi:hypothetical protein